jgi:V-type H+-transporting ATPase subunit E
MTPIAEDIEMLERAILTEAREEAEVMREEAKARAAAVHKRAQEQAAAERKEILERANQDAERLRSQANATAQLKARSVQLEHREKLLDSVFEEVRKQLSAVKDRPDYKDIAALLAREALSQLQASEAEIQADEATRKALNLNELGRELNGKFSFAGTLEEGTGVIATASGGKLYYDNTLETRLKRLQGSLRSAVYKVLMGESA